MERRSFLFRPVLVLLILGGWVTVKSQDQNGAFICGTPDSPLYPLAKTAALPKISKVYSGAPVALMLRIGFPDVPYAVDTATISKTHASVNAFFLNMSRNTYQWTFQIHPDIWITPKPKSAYEDSVTGFDSLRAFIKAQIKAAGLVKGTNYTVTVANFPLIQGISWAGLSYGPTGGDDYINGSYAAGVVGHEMGHLVGLPHSHSIEAGTDIFGTPGTANQNVEYGNPYDIMGRGGINGQFNVMYKWRTGWIDSNEMLDVKNSGTYRIYASDNALHKGNILSIRVPSGNSAYAYWLEYRSVNTNAQKGLTVMFQGFLTNTTQDTWFMDMTPQSRTSNDENDGVLIPGKSFTDKYPSVNGAATVQAVAINSGVWNENGWVDVQITIPGSTPIFARSPNLLHRQADEAAVAYTLTGRRFNGWVPLTPSRPGRKPMLAVFPTPP